MKKYILLWAFTFGVLFAGCSEKKPLVSEEKNEVQETETTPFPTLAPDWSNWFGHPGASSFGMSVNLFDKEDRVFGEWTVISGDAIEAKLVYQLALDELKKYGEAETSVIVTVNDVVCDFELSGQRSENGILTTDKVINQEITDSLLITDCTLNEGENKLGIYLAVYFPQIGKVVPSNYIRKFQAECSRVQTDAELCGTERDLEFSVTTTDGMEEREIKAELRKGNDFFFQQLSFDSSTRCTTIPWDGEMGIEFRNRGGSTGETPMEREVLLLVLKNGEVMPIQGDKSVYLCSVSEQDLRLNIPLDVKAKQGEYAHMALVYFGLDREGDTSFSDRLFYFQ